MVDDNKTDDTESNRDQLTWWLKWIKAAKKASEKHWRAAEEAWNEYEWSGDTNRAYPIYKISVDKLESALFARCPEPRSKRKFGIDDEMALTMALINDRLAEHLIQDGNCFETWCACRSDFIHGAKTAAQVIYTTDTEDYRVPLLARGSEDSAEYYEQDGMSPYAGEVQEEGGQYFYNKPKVIPETQKIRISPCLHDEILHTPEAILNSGITDIAYKFCLSYEEAEEKFNPDGKRDLPYQLAKSYAVDDDKRKNEPDKSTPGKVLEGWECYCLEGKKIYWVCEQYSEDFLLTQEDTLSLRKFFPSTEFALLNKRRKDLYPVPTWNYLKPTANQLNKLYERIFDLLDGIRRRAVVYGASPELIQALNNPENTYVSAGKMLEILEKGGLANLIQWVPVKELVDALTESIQLEEHFKNNFSEFFHLPEILRGQADPDQTATQSEILQTEAHDTFRTIKEMMIKLARDSVDLMLDLAYKVYDDNKIAKIIGYEFLPTGTPAMPPSEQDPQGVPAMLGHKERFMEALQRLRDDEQRMIRVDFETDSTSFRDDAREIERAQMIGKTAIDSLQMIGQMEPQFVPIALNMTLGVLQSMGGSAATEDMIRKAVSDLTKMRSQPPPPPPPDTEMMKVQIQGQALELKNQDNQIKAALENRKVDIKEVEVQMKSMETEAKLEIAKFESQFNAALEKALVQLEQQKTDIAQYSAEVQAQNVMLEEMRLKQDSDANLVASLSTQLATNASRDLETPPVAPTAPVIQFPAPAPQNINVSVHMPKNGKRISKMIRPDGSETVVETMEEQPEPMDGEI